VNARETVSEVRVRYAETDQMGVAYHTHYLVWCEIGRTDHIRSFGESYAAIEAAGVRLAVADAEIRYANSARYDDVIRVRTRVEQVRSRVVTFAYELTRVEDHGETRVASARTRLIALGDDGAPRTLPQQLQQRLREGLDGSA
jgi:acyl-CoA thioester hydrolase